MLHKNSVLRLSSRQLLWYKVRLGAYAQVTIYTLLDISLMKNLSLSVTMSN